MKHVHTGTHLHHGTEESRVGGSTHVLPDGSTDWRAVWDERHAGLGPVELAEPHPLLVDAVGRLRPGTALDLATGDGTNATWLALQGWRVTAVDFSAIGLRRARELADRLRVEVNWVEADLREYVPAARAFDLVTVLYFHVASGERRTILHAAAEAVAPGGTLLVIGHDRSNLTDGIGGPRDPDVLFTAAELAAELAAESPGLVVERAEVVRRGGEGRVPLDALLQARRGAGADR